MTEIQSTAAAWTDDVPQPAAELPKRTPSTADVDALAAAETVRAQRAFDDYFTPAPSGPPAERVIGVHT